MCVHRLDYRQEWDKDFLEYLKGLKGKKPIIYAGDLNVAHQEIGKAKFSRNFLQPAHKQASAQDHNNNTDNKA